MEIICPYCGESSGYDVPESFKGNVSCPKCPKSFYVEIEKGEIKTIRQEPQKELPKSIRADKPEGGKLETFF